VEIFTGDKFDREFLANTCAKLPVDVVVDTMPSVTGLDNIAEFFPQVKNVFIVSSTGTFVPLKQFPADESHEWRIENHVNFHGKIANDKHALELFAKQNFPITIFRPTNIIGDGRVPLDLYGGRDVNFFKALRNNETLELPDCRQITIIGGSVLGLEIADSLLARGLQVTVLERSAQLFPGRMTPEAAAELQTRLNNHERLTIHCGADIAGISRAGVLDNRGMIYPADAVVFAAGAVPRTIIAAEAGLAVGNGIKVDAAMRTSRENIFAAGDAAEFNGRCFNLYMDAVASGKIAGTNAGGAAAEFTAKPSPIRLFALGEKLVM
jgi:pyruvate/2-oxoglutarate dehydrogenase complex dihydrolipoamide dehydrogenase (E3) component